MPELKDHQVFEARAGSEVSILPSVHVEFLGFHPEEQLTIVGDTCFDAAVTFGQKMKDITKETLASKNPDVKDLATSHHALVHFQELSHQGVFTVDGVNYGERYIENLKGFAQGSDIPFEKITYLQTQIDTGCQSLFIQDEKTGQILVAGAEENMDDPKLLALNRRKDRERRLQQKRRRTQQGYGYRAVNWSETGKDMTFFAYPGIAGGGPAIGVNHETKTVTHVDTIFTKTGGVDLSKNVWINAMASMMLDIGDIALAREFIYQAKNYGVVFDGGYAIHMAQAGDRPTMTSFEFGKDQIVEVPPKKVGDRLIIAQPNLPRSTELYALDELNPQNISSEDDPNNPQWNIEMKRRTRRLALMGALADIPKNASPKGTLEYLDRLLANPHGDVEHLQGSRTRDMTGLPSVWSAGYVSAVIEGNTISAHIGKLRPKPLEHKPYALTEQRTVGPQGARRDLKLLSMQGITNHPFLKES